MGILGTKPKSSASHLSSPSLRFLKVKSDQLLENLLILFSRIDIFPFLSTFLLCVLTVSFLFSFLNVILAYINHMD